MAKNIQDCQTPNELAEAIAYHLKQGGMRRDIIHLDTGERKTVHDEHETHRLYGIALNKYNDIRKLYPLPSPQIDKSDPLSALAQLQQLCAETGQEKETISKPNSQNRKIFGDKFELWGLSINYKNLWHFIKSWPCVTKRIKTIRNFIKCKLKNKG